MFKTEIMCGFIALAGTVVSSLISWLVSRSSAAKEIEKLKLTWNHEHTVSSDDDFAQMVFAVANCLQERSSPSFDAAVSYVAAIRSKESGALGGKLDALHQVLFEISQNVSMVNPYGLEYQSSVNRANDCLTEVIDEKRKRQSGQYGAGAERPAK